jgi:hypothetical protein
MTGGAYSVSSFYSGQRFSVTQGQTVRGGMKTGPDHEFCPECMSWMFTRAEEIQGFVNVRSTMFEDAALHRPYVEMFRAEALPGAASEPCTPTTVSRRTANSRSSSPAMQRGMEG